MAKDEFYLPQGLIQHIQSFLNARDNAQSSILSKSWYISCPTRPVLVFDENEFSAPNSYYFSHAFANFCMESLNRYKTLNLKLDKFTLHMKIGEDFSLRNKLAGECITSALDLGLSEIELKLNYYANFNLRYDLPAQVFESTSLIRLSVDRYNIDGVIGDRVLCSRLKSLLFDKVKATNEIVRDILARCPLIENLDLCRCVGLDKLNVSKLINLLGFRFVDGLMASVEFIDLNGMNVTKFCCLRRLQLENVKIGHDFFTDFSATFPCVEDLTLGYCGDYEEVNISSHSLRLLSLRQWVRLKRVQLNVPNISKFVFKSGLRYEAGHDYIERKHITPLPALSLYTVSKDWESKLYLYSSCPALEACWFVDLRKFLNQLRLSRISLNVSFVGEKVISGEEISCIPDGPAVENLRICTCGTNNYTTMVNAMQGLKLGLSRAFRPNLITECRDCQM